MWQYWIGGGSTAVVLLNKELLNKNLAKKNLSLEESNFGRHLMLRFYEKHNLDSKSLLFNKETQVGFFFEVVFGNLMCDCQFFLILT